MKKKLVALTLALLTSGAYAQEEDVIVTANRAPVPADAVSDDVDVITKEEIERFGFTTIADVLQYVAGIHTYSLGGPGKQTGIFVFGLPGKYVLVMVNGVPINDPSTPDGAPNVEWIDLNGVERIEVLKGPQSALYGSEAAAAVINIITKEPTSSYLKASVEGGKYVTFKERAEGAKVFDGGYISFSAENFKTNGFSATNPKAGQYIYNPDNDGFQYTTGYLSAGFKPTERLKIRWDAKVKGGYTEYDEGRTNYDSFFTSINTTYAQGDRVIWDLTLGNNKERRRDIYSYFNGITRYAYLSPTIYINDEGSSFIKPGVSYRHQTAQAQAYPNADGKTYTKSAFLEGHFNLYGLAMTAAYRVDSHKSFGAHSTYKLAASYRFKPTGTTLKGQYGTGFKAPTISQLYGFYDMYGYKLVGNPELRPEKTEGWVIGVEQELELPVKLALKANYFKNHLWNAISTVYSPQIGGSTYQNVGKATTEGAELSAKAALTEWLSLKGNYTHLSIRSQDPLFKLRRPKESFTFGFTVKRGRLTFDAEALHYGSRKDFDYSTYSEVTLPSFTVYNCYASYRLKNGLELYAKGVNLTDKNYELAYGYNTMGRALFVGATYTFK